MKRNIYDILIIGAGPAGLASAITLAKHGYSVLLTDQFSFPREKVCGDGLTGDSINMLKKLGIWSRVEELANKSEKVELYPTFESSFELDSPVYTLKREFFDKILYDYAIKCGADFRKIKFSGGITEVAKDGRSYCAFEFYDSSKNKISIESKYGIIATGCQYTKHLKTLELFKPDLIAVRGYFKTEEINADHPLVFFDNKKEKGYFWIFPMGDNEYNIGYGTDAYQKVDLKKKVKEFLVKRYPNIKLSEIDFLLKGAFLRTNLINFKKLTHKNILITGEVLGSTFPFTGEGIGKALETGIMAGEVIEAALKNNLSVINPADEFSSRVQNILQLKYRPYRIANSLFKINFLSRIFFSHLIKNKKLCDITSKILNDKTNHEHFSTKGMIRYLLSKNK